ncbi:MAG: dynamin, partial [Chloroflexi bacterium]
MMLDVRLTPAQERLVDQVRQWLEALQAALVELKASAEDQEALDQSLRQLDDFFLLVVVGEFNAGKSAFINALLGHPLLEEGVTPTTRAIHLLRYGEEPDRTFQDGLWIQTAPLDLLRTIHIVDTPGTNAVLREHEAITEAFVPRSDLVLFVTSADRPFT